MNSKFHNKAFAPFIKCSYILCKSRHPGVYTPVIQFWAKDTTAMLPPGTAIVNGLKLCENCVQFAKVHEIIDDSRWADICRKLEVAGAPPPNRDTIELLFTKFEKPKAKDEVQNLQVKSDS